MIACFDVHYTDTKGCAAAIAFQSWKDESPVELQVVPFSAPGNYVPGEFFRRELDPLKAVISELKSPVKVFLIDAYCHLSSEGAAGLGVHLANEFGDGRIVIGVAKNRYRDSQHATEVLRGNSLRPLFVTAIGIDQHDAAEHVKSMHGEHRIPTLLKMVDRLARDGVASTQ